MFTIMKVRTTTRRSLTTTTNGQLIVTRRHTFSFTASGNKFSRSFFIRTRHRFSYYHMLNFVNSFTSTSQEPLVHQFSRRQRTRFTLRLNRISAHDANTIRNSREHSNSSNVARRTLNSILIRTRYQARRVKASRQRVNRTRRSLRTAIFAGNTISGQRSRVSITRRFLAKNFSRLLANLTQRRHRFAIKLVRNSRHQIFLIRRRIQKVIRIPITLLISTSRRQFRT